MGLVTDANPWAAQPQRKGFASHAAEWTFWWPELSESDLSTAMGCRALWASLSSLLCSKSWSRELQHGSVSLQSRHPAELPFKACCRCWSILGATERTSCQARHVRCYDSAWSWFTHLLANTMNFFKMTPCLGKVWGLEYNQMTSDCVSSKRKVAWWYYFPPFPPAFPIKQEMRREEHPPWQMLSLCLLRSLKHDEENQPNHSLCLQTEWDVNLYEQITESVLLQKKKKKEKEKEGWQCIKIFFT